MSKMVERVAFAIEAAMFAPHELPLDTELHAKYLATARDVIMVMREPTAEMLLAAAPFPLHLVIERADQDYTNNMEAATAADRMAARSKYQTMIDAALSASGK